MDDMATRKINHSETQGKTQIDETRQMNLNEIKKVFVSHKEERSPKTIAVTEVESATEPKDFYKLIARTQEEGFKEYILDQESVTFGRSQDCSVPLNDKIVSKYHSLILVTKDECTLKDLESKNGTYVNDLPIYHKRLRHLDKIKIGDTVFLFVDKEGTVILPDDFPLSDKKKDTLLQLLFLMLIASGILLIIVIIIYFFR